MIEKTGVATEKELQKTLPPAERLHQGPAVIVECFQKIPCNPCSKACSKGAILASEDINECPVVDWEKCNGCGVCISKCPGLAMFVVDETFSASETLIKLPYEFLPLPREGAFVTGLDRAGKPVCRSRVIKVLNAKVQDKTPVISIAVPKEMGFLVRNIRLDDYFGDHTIVCRCEEITLGEIRQLIANGYKSLDEIKRISRCGMGSCQGRTCRQLVMQEIAALDNIPIQDLMLSTFRPPTKPIKLDLLLGDEKND